MAQQPVTLDAWFANINGGSGNGNGTKMGSGKGVGAWAFQQRLGLYVPRPPGFANVTDAAQFGSAGMHLRCSSANAGIGSSVKLRLGLGTTPFTEVKLVANQGGVGSNIDAYVVNSGAASGHWPGPTRDDANKGEYEGSPSNGDWINVPLLAMTRWWWARPAIGGLILVGRAFDEDATAQRCTFHTHESASPPYFEWSLAAGGTNRAPDKPADVEAFSGGDGTSMTVSWTATDPDGDTLTKHEVVVMPYG